MSTAPPDTGHWPRQVNSAAAPGAALTPSSGAPQRRLGLALAVIAAAQLIAIALLALIITVIAIRVKRADLAGINPMAAPAGSRSSRGPAMPDRSEQETEMNGTQLASK